MTLLLTTTIGFIGIYSLVFAWGYVRELQEAEEYWRETCEKMIAGGWVAAVRHQQASNA